MTDESEQQEQILYFVKESFELDHRQIQETAVGHFHFVLVSFSGGLYFFEKNIESDEVKDDSTPRKHAFLDFDHNLELPFTKTIIISDTTNLIQLLVLSRNGEACFLSVSLSSTEQFNASINAITRHIISTPNKETNRQLKNAKLFQYSSPSQNKQLSSSPSQGNLLLIYAFQIYLADAVKFQKRTQQTIFFFVNYFAAKIVFGNPPKNSLGSPAELIFDSQDEEIDQIGYEGSILCISTFKRYYTLDITTREAIRLGTKEKQGFFGVTFFPPGQNKEVIAARPNGYMWKVEAKTGEVAKTLQFKDEDNNKLSFGRLYSFDRFILSISGENKLLIIDMADRQLVTKIYHNSSGLKFLNQETNHQQSHFYLQYSEGDRTFVFERCSIKPLQQSFETSLAKRFIGECAELFEKYETLQTIQNLKVLLAANLTFPSTSRCRFSSAFKDSVKRIEAQQFGWGRDSEVILPSSKEKEIEKLEKIKLDLKEQFSRTTEIQTMKLQQTDISDAFLLQEPPINNLHQSSNEILKKCLQRQQNYFQAPQSLKATTKSSNQSWNTLIQKKIIRHHRLIFRKNLLALLSSRNPHEFSMLSIFLSNLPSFLLLACLSRNFIKIITHLPSINCYFFHLEISVLLQEKSSRDILNDSNICHDIEQLMLIERFEYYLGHQLSLEEIAEMLQK